MVAKSTPAVEYIFKDSELNVESFISWEVQINPVKKSFATLYNIYNQLIISRRDSSQPLFNLFNDIGANVLKISKIVPDGIILVFPTQKMINLCHLVWKNNYIWGELKMYKNIISNDTRSSFRSVPKETLKKFNSLFKWRNVKSESSNK